MQCGVSPAWTTRIRERLEAGASDEQILDEFVQEYGRAVLIAPPLEGFNWVGYLTPAMALILGGALVGVVLRRTVARAPRPQPVAPVSSEEWDRLRAEISKLEAEEGSADW